MKRGLPRDERREMVGRRLRVQAAKERARLEMGVYRGTRASSSRASDSDVNENRESLAPSSDFSPRRFRAARRAGGWLVSAPRPRQETESGQNGKRETAEAVPPVAEEEDDGAKQEREREKNERFPWRLFRIPRTGLWRRAIMSLPRNESFVRAKLARRIPTRSLA